MKYVVLLTAALLAATVARAGDGASTLVGEARLKVLFWSVYESRLYSENGEYTFGQLPLRFDIEYLMSVDAQALVERTEAEWREQGVGHERQQEWLARLLQIWPDVSEQDVLTLEVDRDGVSTFYRNGELLGDIDDAAFGEQFLGIWLSPDTSRPALRRGLLGVD